MNPSVAARQHVVNDDDRPPERTPAGDAFTTFLGQVIGLTRRFTTAGEALAKPTGQTLARWLVMETIQDRPATVAQIARTLLLARQGVQRLADLLVQDGLAVYEDNPAHRRARLVRLTPEGRSTLRAIQAAQRDWADAMGAELGEAQLRQASGILERVLEVLRMPGPAPGPERPRNR
jgi:DNA-binding MarR family transcriptional regulator